MVGTIEVPERDQLDMGKLTAWFEANVEGFEGPIRVHEVREDVVILDFNNPLAGKTLTFDIRIVSLD